MCVAVNPEEERHRMNQQNAAGLCFQSNTWFLKDLNCDVFRDTPGPLRAGYSLRDIKKKAALRYLLQY